MFVRLGSPRRNNSPGCHITDRTAYFALPFPRIAGRTKCATADYSEYR